jgi:hypothetical protein
MSGKVLIVEPLVKSRKFMIFGTIRRFIDKLDNQPLVSTELRHWARPQAPVSKGWRRSINLLLGWATLLISIILFLSEMLRDDLTIVPYEVRWLMGVYALLAFVFYSTPWNRSQRLALRMIGRDKGKAANWELIALTGVDARTYVFAKWWVLLRTTFPMLLYAGVVRAGAVTFLVAEFTRSGAANVLRFSNNIVVYPPVAFDILMLGLLSVLLTFVGMPSLMALQLDTNLNAPRYGGIWWVSLVRAILIFCGTIVLLVGAASLVVNSSRTSNNPLLSIMLGTALLTSFDNGLIVTAQLAAFTFVYGQRAPDLFMQLDGGSVLLIVLLSLPLTAFSTWFWLRMAEWSARRYHLVPHQRR